MRPWCIVVNYFTLLCPFIPTKNWNTRKHYGFVRVIHSIQIFFKDKNVWVCSFSFSCEWLTDLWEALRHLHITPSFRSGSLATRNFVARQTSCLQSIPSFRLFNSSRALKIVKPSQLSFLVAPCPFTSQSCSPVLLLWRALPTSSSMTSCSCLCLLYFCVRSSLIVALTTGWPNIVSIFGTSSGFVQITSVLH